jgi:hypothetical protein
MGKNWIRTRIKRIVTLWKMLTVSDVKLYLRWHVPATQIIHFNSILTGIDKLKSSFPLQIREFCPIPFLNFGPLNSSFITPSYDYEISFFLTIFPCILEFVSLLSCKWVLAYSMRFIVLLTANLTFQSSFS